MLSHKQFTNIVESYLLLNLSQYYFNIYNYSLNNYEPAFKVNLSFNTDSTKPYVNIDFLCLTIYQAHYKKFLCVTTHRSIQFVA